MLKINMLKINYKGYEISQAINKYIDELEESSKLSELWCKSQQENQELKKQLEERPKEYVFIGNAQNKTRDFINQITKDNKELENQQKEFIELLEKEIVDSKAGSSQQYYAKEHLILFKEIIGGKGE